MLLVLPKGFRGSFYLAQVADQAVPNTPHILGKRPLPDMTKRVALLVYASNSNHIGIDIGIVESNRVAPSNFVLFHGLATQEIVTAGENGDLAGDLASWRTR